MDSLCRTPENQRAMDNKSLKYKQHFGRAKVVPKKEVFASPSSQPSSEAFAVPLPSDTEDDDSLLAPSVWEKHTYVHVDQNKQDYRKQDEVRQVPEENINPPQSYSCISLYAAK